MFAPMSLSIGFTVFSSIIVSSSAGGFILQLYTLQLQRPIDEIRLSGRCAFAAQGARTKARRQDSVASGEFMFENTFFDVLDELSAKKRPSDVFLKSIAKRYGLDHVVYFTINLPVSTVGPYFATTYSPQWVSHYFAKNYASIDPALHQTLGGILPVDWSTIDRKALHIRKFFGEAMDFGVGNQGLSFPIRGLHHETAVFSLAAN